VTAELPLCPGGRCSQVLAAVVQWRHDYVVSVAERVGGQMADVFRGSLDDADLPPEVRRRLTEALIARMSRFAKGLADEPPR
jgi:hypothetical protein